MATNANRYTQTAHSGGSHQPAEFPFQAQQIRKRVKLERETARLIEMIREMDLLNLSPDDALAKMERRSGVRGVMEALRRWLRADREAHD